MPKFNVTKKLFYELKRASLNHLFDCFSLLLEESISVFFLQNAILVPLVLIVKTSVIHAVTLHVRELTEIVQMAALTDLEESVVTQQVFHHTVQLAYPKMHHYK